MYPLMENQPYAADCERVGFGDITDRGTTPRRRENKENPRAIPGGRGH